MSNGFFLPFKVLIFLIVFIIIFISVFFIPISPDAFYSYDGSLSQNIVIDISSSGYAWPSPGYTGINSYFGYRTSPTAGASSYHSGLDIAAPEGSKLIAVTSGQITFASFLGGGGYTITLTSGNIKFTYCHVSPHYIVKVGDYVVQGQVIGYVGPKNVYGVKGNQYFDENGNPTNGATTGPHLHFGVRVNGEYIDPLTLFN